MESSGGRGSRVSAWLAAAALTGLAVLFVSLGFWQIDRGHEKQALAGAFAAGGSADRLTELPPDAGQALYASAAVSGRYDSEHQILLDAMTYRGAAGYQVLTPFEPVGSSRWLLVNRGWIGGEQGRESLPSVAVPENRRRVVGRVAELPRPGLRLATPGPPERRDGVEVRLYPTIEELEDDLGRPLYPYQLWLSPQAADGYVRDWHPGGLPAAQHFAYAVQWFALAALVVVVGVWLGLRELRSRRSVL